MATNNRVTEIGSVYTGTEGRLEFNAIARQIDPKGEQAKLWIETGSQAGLEALDMYR